MKLAKGKIPYPLLIESTCIIYDVYSIFKNYNNLTYPLIFLDLTNSACLHYQRLHCLIKTKQENKQKFLTLPHSAFVYKEGRLCKEFFDLKKKQFNKKGLFI